MITGASHTGKTVLAQKLLQKYQYPYLSIVREIIKTTVENKQNLVVEGCYIPFHWKEDFSEIKEHADEIEQRMDDTGCTMNSVLKDNAYYLEMCQKHGGLLDERKRCSPVVCGNGRRADYRWSGSD